MGQISRRTLTTAAAAAAVTAGSVTIGGGTSYAASGRRDGAQNGRRQFRGMWLTTAFNRDWPTPGLSPAEQRRELAGLLDIAVARRLNAVVLQVRGLADALWPSPYEPWAKCLTGVQGRDPGWDPLDFAVREAHLRGLELHAWFNPYRIATHPDPARLSAAHPARLHPEWVVPYGKALFYNPGLPEVRRFVQDAMLDAVARYDVDGLHWDDYFYPYPIPGQTFDDDAAYARYGGDFPDRAAWRRDNIDLLVRGTGLRIEELNRSPLGGGSPRERRVRFGVSPFAIWRNRTTDPEGSDTQGAAESYDGIYADTRTWVRRGWIDYIAPMIYWHIGNDVADYARLVSWWAETCRGTNTHLYIGEALYKAGNPAQFSAWQDPAELSRHLTFGHRFPEVRGNIYFAAKEVAADRIGAMRRVVADHYPTRVRTPR
ncbi:family 10 glycosylhydrolase [Streptomyces sp. SID13666]|uniref:glycoside hydrolase family 10 protein n=1 Tax=unclassified Streptomyces TaxID=2593676 RepID=UPI0013C1BB39|nr:MULTISPECIES: family 10 glycosylhydrolase [unclassified Streptomyces]NEA56901.1 family 10 glycosylhydrolase [Streptomyces sp. SID13666]NEA75729.1 family 10 glycosylhydrolase [Streptomyces sp. SID13588]